MIPAPAISAIHFGGPLPLSALIAVAGIGLAVHLYRGERRSTPPATVRLLTALRVLAVLLAVVVTAAPAYVGAQQRHSRGPLYLVVDDSRSMSRIDSSMSKSRAALADEALSRIRPALNQFDVTVVPLGQSGSSAPTDPAWFESAQSLLASTQVSSTPIGETLTRLAAESQNPSTIVLVSDGRQNKGALPEPAARTLAANGSRVFGLAVGSAEVVRDAAIESIDAPRLALSGDSVPISASLRLDAIDQPVTLTLARDGKTIATKQVPATPAAHADFVDSTPPEGDHTYAVSIAPVPGEATPGNNTLTAKVTVRREKIRVLLIDDEPRWEYQFLKSVLQTDSMIDLQSRLFDPARIENVSAPPLDPLPTTDQNWSAFDVVILGDVPPTALSPETQSALVTALRRGKPGALVLIAGQRNLPARYAATPLADLFPVDLSQPATLTASDASTPHFSLEADASPLVRLLPDEQLNRAFWYAFPQFSWPVPNFPAKPAARIYWEAGSGADRTPILSGLSYGSGRVLYLATPETWRLRYVQSADGQVSDLHRRFWSQTIRWAVAPELAANDSSDRDVEDSNLSADPRLLDRLAKAANGASFPAADADKLAAALPTVEHVETVTTRLGFFEDPAHPSTRYLHWAALLIFVALLTIEWVIRKRKGLV